MAEPKTVRVKEDRICCHCGGLIEKDSQADFLTGKSPRFNADGVQIGIQYWKYWAHYNIAVCDAIIDAQNPPDGLPF